MIVAGRPRPDPTPRDLITGVDGAGDVLNPRPQWVIHPFWSVAGERPVLAIIRFAALAVREQT